MRRPAHFGKRSTSFRMEYLGVELRLKLPLARVRVVGGVHVQQQLTGKRQQARQCLAIEFSSMLAVVRADGAAPVAPVAFRFQVPESCRGRLKLDEKLLNRLAEGRALRPVKS